MHNKNTFMISQKINFSFPFEFIGSHLFGGMGRKMFPSAGKTVEDGYLIHVGPTVDPGDCPAMIGQVSATQYMPMTGHRWHKYFWTSSQDVRPDICSIKPKRKSAWKD